MKKIYKIYIVFFIVFLSVNLSACGYSEDELVDIISNLEFDPTNCEVDFSATSLKDMDDYEIYFVLDLDENYVFYDNSVTKYWVYELEGQPMSHILENGSYTEYELQASDALDLIDSLTFEFETKVTDNFDIDLSTVTFNSYSNKNGIDTIGFSYTVPGYDCEAVIEVYENKLVGYELSSSKGTYRMTISYDYELVFPTRM